MVLTIRVVSIEAVSESVMIVMMILTNYSEENQFFFYLEYGQHLLVRHVLDVMHIEKNVCESIYGTLLHQRGKTKDGVKARRDLIELQIRGKLIPSENDKNSIPEHLTP